MNTETRSTLSRKYCVSAMYRRTLIFKIFNLDIQEAHSEIEQILDYSCL